MGNRRQDRFMRKEQRFVEMLKTLALAREEIEMFRLICWFRRLVRQVQKNRYHKPSHVFIQREYDNLIYIP
jgi:hypothetical protein